MGFKLHAQFSLVVLSLVTLSEQLFCAEGASSSLKEIAAVQEEMSGMEGGGKQTDSSSLERSDQTSASPIGKRMFDPHSVKRSNNLWVEGEALLWQAHQDDMDYAIKSDSNTRISHGDVKQPHFDWDWGFRLGLGYKLPYDKWDIFLNYTYVHAHAHGSVATSNGAIFPGWEAPFGVVLLPGQTLYATHAQAHWNAHVNIGDIELGRNCFVGKWLSIRPFVSVRGVWIDQNYHIGYAGGTAAPTGDKDQVSLRNDFWGVGLRMGFDSLWGLGAGWSIYGNGAASLLSGHFDIHQDEKLKIADTQKVRLSDDIENVVVAAELALGIQWDYLFSQDRYHFGVKFGWEFNVFFDQNQMVRFVSDTSPGAISRNDGDLSFQGLTLGIRFDF